MSVDEIQDIEVLRTLVKMQQQESARLRLQLAEALSKLPDKSGADAEQLVLKLDKIEKQHAAALKQLCGPKSERGELARTGKNGSPSSKTGHGPKEQQKLGERLTVARFRAREMLRVRYSWRPGTVSRQLAGGPIPAASVLEQPLLRGELASGGSARARSAAPPDAWPRGAEGTPGRVRTERAKVR